MALCNVEGAKRKAHIEPVKVSVHDEPNERVGPVLARQARAAIDDVGR
jgi:hypothetical protein